MDSTGLWGLCCSGAPHAVTHVTKTAQKLLSSAVLGKCLCFWVTIRLGCSGPVQVLGNIPTA